VNIQNFNLNLKLFTPNEPSTTIGTLLVDIENRRVAIICVSASTGTS